MIRNARSVLLPLLCIVLSGCGATSNQSLSQGTTMTCRGPQPSGIAPQFVLKRRNGQSSVIRLFGVYYAAKSGNIIIFTDDAMFACYEADAVAMVPWTDIACISINRDRSRGSQPMLEMRVTTRAHVVHTIPLAGTATWGGIEITSHGEEKALILRFDDIVSVCKVSNGGPVKAQ